MTDLAAQLSLIQHVDASATLMLPDAKAPTQKLVKMRSFGVGEGSTVFISIATGIAILSLWWLLYADDAAARRSAGHSVSCGHAVG